MKKWMLIAGAAGLLGIGMHAGATFGWLGGTHTATKASKHSSTSSDGSAAKPPSTKKHDYLTLNYPGSTGRTPEGMTSSYDHARDRTKLTLKLSPIRIRSSGNFRASEVELKFTSEYHGTSRPKDIAESSLTGILIARVDSAGVLATSGSPGTFIADAEPIEAKPASKTKNGYSLSRGSNVEAMSFKVDVKDFLKICEAKSVTAKFGLLDIELSPAQIADLRELAARLNPNS